MTRQPIALSATRQIVRADEQPALEVNFHDGFIRVPLSFRTTLGVTSQTYAYIGAVGAILSALLGGGWVWQVATWLKGQNAKPAPHVSVSRRRGSKEG